MRVTVSKQSLLLVDGDTRSLRVLEVSLRKAGFTVTPAQSVQDALDKLELHAPDLIISETTFAERDGFDLRLRVRAKPDWAEIPFVFLTASAAIENKIRGLELGVDDYLTKPIYIKEIVTRINILLQKRQRARFEERRDGRTRFAGRVADMPVVDVIQTIEISRKSGVIQFTGDGGRQGAIYFRDGKVIDAEADALSGEDAVYRLLTWSDGEFEVVFRTVRRRDAITASSQGLLMEGMRRLDEWTRLLEQLPALTHRFEVDTAELVGRLGEVPDDNNVILRLIDGKRTLNEVIDACEFGDLECLQAISRLFFEGLLLDLDHDAPTKRDTGRPMPLVQIEDDSPFQYLPDVDDLGDLRTDDPTDELTPAPAPPPLPPAEAEPVEDDIQAHALMGGYRHSSLMLIDAAVAAAQAIEPALFDDDAPGALETARREARARAQRESDEDAEIVVEAGDPSLDDSVPHSIEADEPSRPARGLGDDERTPIPGDPDNDDTPVPGFRRGRSSELASRANDFAGADHSPRPEPTFELEDPTPRPGAFAARATPASRVTDPGLRMIGSLGRDRAEASGEVLPAGGLATPGAVTGSTQRELVTILPRRITRELPALTDAPRAEAAPTAPTPGEARPSRTESDFEADTAPGRGPLLSPLDREREARQETEPGVRAGGPSYLTLGLVALAILLGGLAVYLHFQKPTHPDAPPVHMTVTPEGADPAPTAELDAAPAVVLAPADAAEAEAVVIDAASADAATPADAAAPPIDARGAPPPSAGPDPIKRAHALMDEAGDAVRTGKFDEAIALIDQSLRLRRTAHSYLLKATALQKLDRIDEALVAIDEAISLAPSWPPAWVQRGHVLWGAHRYDEGRVAFERYLQLSPAAPDASAIKHMLSEPR